MGTRSRLDPSHRARVLVSRATRRLTLLVASAFLLSIVVLPASPAFAAPDFQLKIDPESQTLQPGSFVRFSVGVVGLDGFTDSIQLRVDGLPTGVTGSFDINPITLTGSPPSGTSFLTISASEDAEVGTSQLIVTATGGGVTQTATGEARVDFGLVPICYGSVVGTVTDRDSRLPIEGVRIAGLRPMPPVTTASTRSRWTRTTVRSITTSRRPRIPTTGSPRTMRSWYVVVRPRLISRWFASCLCTSRGTSSKEPSPRPTSTP